MDLGKQGSHHLPTTRWYAGDDETDSWISYLYRNFHHIEGESSPFPGTEWVSHDDDMDLHDKVLKALYDCPGVDASLIRIFVVKRTVSLEGSVVTDAELKIAEEAAKTVQGVWYVKNNLVSEHGRRSPGQAP